MCILGAILAFLLPETSGRNLPETVEEIEQWSLTLSPAELERHYQQFKLANLYKGVDNEGFQPDEDQTQRAVPKDNLYPDVSPINNGEVIFTADDAKQPTDEDTKL